MVEFTTDDGRLKVESATPPEPVPMADASAADAPLQEQDPQAAVRESIAEKFDRLRLAEIEAQRAQLGLEPSEPEEVTAPPAAVAVETPAEPPQAEAALVPQPAVPAPTYAQPPQVYPLQLPDGRIAYVTQEQAAYLAQVGAAALTQQPAAPRQAAAPQPTPTHGPSFDSDRARAIAQRLSYGNTEEQAQALQEFAKEIRPAIPQVDVEQLRQQTKNELRQELRLEQNLAIIGQEYNDIFTNTVRSQVAALTLHGLRSNPANARFDDLTLYREACNIVRRELNLPTPQPQPQRQSTPASQAVPATSPERLERKRAAPSIPSATDSRPAMTPTAPQEPSRAEIVAQMRKARGQPAIN